MVVDDLDFQAGRSVALDEEGNAVVYWYQFFGGYSARGHSADGQMKPVFDILPYSGSISPKPFEAIALGAGEFALLREIEGDALELHRHALDGTVQSAFPVVEAVDPLTDWVATPSVVALTSTVYAAGWTAGEGPFWTEADVFYRLFNLAGDTSAIAQLNTLTAGEQSYTELDAHEDGTLVAVWRSDGSVGTDDDGFSVQGRLFPPVGAPSDQFQVNTTEAGDQHSVDVAFGDDGSFLVVWRGLADPQEDWTHVWSQKFALDGTPIGPEVRLSSGLTGPQIAPRVVEYEDGHVVVWSRYAQKVLGRVVGPDGLPVGDVFRIDNVLPQPGSPAAASLPSGDLVVSWPRYANTGGPVSARRFKSLLFADGFESGGLTAWSTSVP